MKRWKQIMSWLVGMVMVSSTIASALAANLSTFPDPFIQGGRFYGSIVVGDKAAAEDVVGAIDIATSLQYSSTTVVGDSIQQKSIDGILVRQAGKEGLNYGDSIEDVDSKLDEEDLPTVLNEGVYRESRGNTENDVTYTQELQFSDDTMTLVFEKNDEDFTATFLKVAKNKLIYTYSLRFDNEVEFDNSSSSEINDDFDGSNLRIMGQLFMITGATGTPLSKLTLMGGTVEDTIEEGEIKTYTVNEKEYEVTAVIIADRKGTAKFKINGEVTDEMAEGNTYKLSDGIRIGVRNIMPNEAGEITGGDVADIYLGAREIVLEDGAEVELNRQDIDGSEVNLIGTGDSLREIQIKFTAEDNEWLSEDDKWTDPVLGKFKVLLLGIDNTPAEKIKAKVTSDDGELTFINNDGKTVKIPAIYDETSNKVVLGDDIDYLPLVSGNAAMFITDGETCTGIADVTECENILALAKSGTGELHVLEITNIDNTKQKISIKDKTSGKIYTDQIVTNPIDLGFTTVKFSITATVLTAVDIGSTNTIKTKYNAELDLIQNVNEINVTLTDDDNLATEWFVFEANSDSDGMEIDKLSINMRPQEKDSSIKVGIDSGKWGTVWAWDSENKDNLEIVYPEERVLAKIYIAPTSADITEITGQGQVIIQKIEVGSAKLASEIINIGNQNLLMVGGPCANKIAAQVMGVPSTIPECLAGFEEGKAIIKLYEQPTGKVAMLVAGATALDTRRASRVIANYKSYNLAGNEIEVTGTSLNDISIKKIV